MLDTSVDWCLVLTRIPGGSEGEGTSAWGSRHPPRCLPGRSRTASCTCPFAQELLFEPDSEFKTSSGVWERAGQISSRAVTSSVGFCCRKYSDRAFEVSDPRSDSLPRFGGDRGRQQAAACFRMCTLSPSSCSPRFPSSSVQVMATPCPCRMEARPSASSTQSSAFRSPSCS